MAAGRGGRSQHRDRRPRVVSRHPRASQLRGPADARPHLDRCRFRRGRGVAGHLRPDPRRSPCCRRARQAPTRATQESWPSESACRTAATDPWWISRWSAVGRPAWPQLCTARRKGCRRCCSTGSASAVRRQAVPHRELPRFPVRDRWWRSRRSGLRPGDEVRSAAVQPVPGGGTRCHRRVPALDDQRRDRGQRPDRDPRHGRPLSAVGGGSLGRVRGSGPVFAATELEARTCPATTRSRSWAGRTPPARLRLSSPLAVIR